MKLNPVKLSVVIPCYNSAETLSAQLEALISQPWTEPWEIILSDNGSTDNSVAIAQSFQQRFPQLRIIDSSAQKGAAHARNIGAQEARGECLAFCDADDIVAPGWVAAMGNALTVYPFVAGSMECEQLNQSWVRQSRETTAQEVGQTPPYGTLRMAAACNLGVWRSLHAAVGGFDNSLCPSEDDDYCWRVRQQGVELRFIPEAMVYYRYRDSLKALYQQYRAYGRSEVLVFKKNQPDFYCTTWTQLSQHWFNLFLSVPKRQQTLGNWARWISNLGWVSGLTEGYVQYIVLRRC